MVTDQPQSQVSVVVPCFNEAGAVADTVRGLRSSMEGWEPLEIVVVDDGLNEGSLDIARSLDTEFGSDGLVLIDYRCRIGRSKIRRVPLAIGMARLGLVIGAAYGPWGKRRPTTRGR